jgi:ribosomal peptide maturation radical SAM protein 1
MAEPFLQWALSTQPFGYYDVVGFTSLFEQNIPSLSLAHRIKRLYPKTRIVFGGPNWEGIMGQALHRRFNFVDYVCSGEADVTLPELLRRISYGHPIHDLAGIVYRKNSVSYATGTPVMLENLDEAETPEFDDYFSAVKNSPFFGMFEPQLIWETSRGCWWGRIKQCTFCGLNGQSMLYRTKSDDRVISEFDHLCRRYPFSVIRAADNALPLSHFNAIIPELGAKAHGKTLIFELRANVTEEKISQLKKAGVTVVQIGVEHLVTNVLRLMNKGTTTLLNIQSMKLCKQYGIYADWNIIYGFPGEKIEDYERLIELCGWITHLSPPTGCGPIRLDRFSYNFENAESLGLIDIRPAGVYSVLYPFNYGDLFDICPFFDFRYKNKINNEHLLPTLNAIVQQWKNSQDSLEVLEDGDRIIINDTRFISPERCLSFSGVAKDIYLYCYTIKSISEIKRYCRELPSINSVPLGGMALDDRLEVASKGLKTENKNAGQADSDSRVQPILDTFLQKHLMIQEEDRFLSLGIVRDKNFRQSVIQSRPEKQLPAQNNQFK